MKTSSDHQYPSSPQPRENWAGGEHWFELTATLSPESTEKFADWLTLELSAMEEELDSFVTPNSLHRSIRRANKG